MVILIIAEHDNSVLKEATLNAVTAATQIGGELHILVAGFDCQSVAEQAAQVKGVSKVIMADAPAYQHHLAENVVKLVTELVIKKLDQDYSHIVTSATTTGKNLMPRVAALLDVAQISDIIKVESSDIFQRPIYAGNAFATVESLDHIKVITVRVTAFEAAEINSPKVAIKTLNTEYDAGISALISEEVTKSERPELTAAKVVISGGRGMGNSANFALLEKVADKLGGAVGASRAAVDADFVANDMQIGQTGKIIAPDLYVAVGISGAIQHLAGMKDSKVIVAINKDEDAPIFQIADYGLVADLFDVLPELAEKL